MKEEKTDRIKVSRTLRQRRSDSGQSEFANNRPNSIFPAAISPVQRLDNDDEARQEKFEPPLQQLAEDEDEALQGKFGEPVQKRNETGLPDHLKTGIEALSGYSLDDVRVHYDSDRPATVQALAYAQGTEIHVAPGQERHLPHEAWHVAQQMAGRVQPTTEIDGVSINDNVELEREADAMGAKANDYQQDRV